MGSWGIWLRAPKSSFLETTISILCHILCQELDDDSALVMLSGHLISNTHYTTDPHPGTLSGNSLPHEPSFWELTKCSETHQISESRHIVTHGLSDQGKYVAWPRGSCTVRSVKYFRNPYNLLCSLLCCRLWFDRPSCYNKMELMTWQMAFPYKYVYCDHGSWLPYITIELSNIVNSMSIQCNTLSLVDLTFTYNDFWSMCPLRLVISFGNIYFMRNGPMPSIH